MAINYTVNHSDPNKNPIIVPEQNSVDTGGITFVGRNFPGYGQAFNQNFLSLLENFASPNPPQSTTEGQLWYQSDTNTLMVNTPNGFIPSNRVYQQDGPPVTAARGDIWVDTQNTQLNIHNGYEFVLIGPTVTGGAKTGSYPATIKDRATGGLHNVILMYLNDTVLEIIAKEAFVPLEVIEGFDSILPGVNVSSKLFQDKLPIFNGVSNAALGLKQTSPSTQVVSANNFLRKDIDQATRGQFVIDNDNGLAIGNSKATFVLTRDGANNKFTNIVDRGLFTFNTFQDGVRYVPLAVDGRTNRVGVNTFDPQTELDVTGSVLISKKLTVKSNSSDGSIAAEVFGILKTGGVVSTGTVTISASASVRDNLTITGNIVATTSSQSIGTLAKPFNQVFGLQVGMPGDTSNSQATFYGKVAGTAGGLTYPITISFGSAGAEFTSDPVSFDGRSGSTPPAIAARLTKDSILNRVEISSYTKIKKTDYLSLANGDTGAFYRAKKQDFLQDVYAGIFFTGAIIPYGGTTAPTGWVWCNGAERLGVGEEANLRNVLQSTYGTPSDPYRYKVPNLNGIAASPDLPGDGPFALYTSATISVPQVGIRYIIKL